MTLAIQSNILAQALGNDPNAKYILLGLVGILVLYIVARPFLRKPKKDPLDRTAKVRTLSQTRSTERQMETLLVELSDMSRQMTAQLDTRAAKLEALIKDADDRIDHLHRATAEAAHAQAARGIASPGEMFADPASTHHHQTQSRTTSPLRHEPSEMIDIDPTHAAVHRLADEGKSIPDIAATLGRPSGEVELILALRPKATR